MSTFIDLNDDELYISKDGKRYLDVFDMDDVDEIVEQIRVNLKEALDIKKQKKEAFDEKIATYTGFDINKIREEYPDIDEELPL